MSGSSRTFDLGPLAQRAPAATVWIGRLQRSTATAAWMAEVGRPCRFELPERRDLQAAPPQVSKEPEADPRLPSLTFNSIRMLGSEQAWPERPLVTIDRLVDAKLE